MTDNQQFAAAVVALVPDGATWFFRVHEDDFGSFLPGIKGEQVGPYEWKALIGRAERQTLLHVLAQDHDDQEWWFAGAESIIVELEGKRILEGFDGMEFVYFSRYFRVSDEFYSKYFEGEDERAGQAKDW